MQQAPKQDLSTVAENWIVLKFGGTSVAGRRQWETIARLAESRRSDGFRVLLVCSAVAGVTNLLNELTFKPGSADRLEEILEIHRRLGRELEVDEELWLAQAEVRLQECLNDLTHEPGHRYRAALVAMGEWLSTRIGHCFLLQRFDTAWVDVREALEAIDEPDVSPARKWLSAACHAAEAPGLAGRWSALSPVLITQGFVARNNEGETVLLGRGGSDTSAALLAGRLSAQRLEIWTDVPGLFSADPRLVNDARLLIEVDYAEALEMAASGAKVVHPRCIRAAAATRTPVVIGDLNRLGVTGTRIGTRVSDAQGVKTVTCQHNMAVVLLQNLDARFQVGFLAGVFEIFRRRGISIDLVATSETTTTVAINCETNHLGDDELKDLSEALGSLCKVKLFSKCVCVNLVGRGARTALSRLQDVMQYFEERPLLMVSQSANDLCLSLLVHSGDHELLLQDAHRALIPAVEESRNTQGVFGASWQQIQPELD
jgi:diaminopimelate decarboxylase/aspartate kinase